jgi:hypothetical protein
MEDPKLIPCPECGGTGKVPLRLDNLSAPAPPLEIDCPNCGGTSLVRDPIPRSGRLSAAAAAIAELEPTLGVR